MLLKFARSIDRGHSTEEARPHSECGKAAGEEQPALCKDPQNGDGVSARIEPDAVNPAKVRDLVRRSVSEDENRDRGEGPAPPDGPSHRQKPGQRRVLIDGGQLLRRQSLSGKVAP